MDIRQANSITGVGSTASARVASSLSPRSAATSKTAGTVKPMASTATTAATDSSDITSSDFLTLLVSELQNQDPTQPADPNAYITQLVQVNSLEQLIQINQTGQQTGGSAVSLLNDIDLAVDPNSPVASSSTSGTASASGSNANDIAAAIASADPTSGQQASASQNAMWNAAVSNQ